MLIKVFTQDQTAVYVNPAHVVSTSTSYFLGRTFHTVYLSDGRTVSLDENNYNMLIEAMSK